MRENSDPFTDISVSIHRYLIPSQFHASNKCETDQISVNYPIIDQEYKKRKFETNIIHNSKWGKRKKRIKQRKRKRKRLQKNVCSTGAHSIFVITTERNSLYSI